MVCEKMRHFEKQLAFHTAPALLGIKSAGLLSVCKSKADIDAGVGVFNKKAKVKGLEIKVLCDCENRSLVLVFNREKLSKEIFNECGREFLDRHGYKNCETVDECLDILGEKISQSNNFPHEIGIFLGYPLEDVEGFIKNNGENYKVSGYWKVYGDEKKALRTFENYNRCRRFLVDKLNMGSDIYQALKIA